MTNSNSNTNEDNAVMANVAANMDINTKTRVQTIALALTATSASGVVCGVEIITDEALIKLASPLATHPEMGINAVAIYDGADPTIMRIFQDRQGTWESCLKRAVESNDPQELNGLYHNDINIPKILHSSNTSYLEGGSWYLPENKAGIIKEDFVSVGTISMVGTKSGYTNVSDKRIVFVESYDTTACGMADEIAIEPGESIVKVSGGDTSSFATYKVWNGYSIANLSETTFQVCKECGEVINVWSNSYISERNDAYSVRSNKDFENHVSGECEFSYKYSTTVRCDDCGEEIRTYTPKEMSEDTDGLNKLIDSLTDEHTFWCEVAREERWELWHAATDTDDGTNPFELVQRLLNKGDFKAAAKVPTPPDRQYDNDWGYELNEFIETFIADTEEADMREKFAIIGKEWPVGLHLDAYIGWAIKVFPEGSADWYAEAYKITWTSNDYRRAGAMGITL